MTLAITDTSLKVDFRCLLTNTTANDLSGQGNDVKSHLINMVKPFIFTNGQGANQGNQAWVSRQTLDASDSVELDLAGGLTDAFGTALTFAEIKLIMVYADDNNTNNVLVGGAAANAFSTMFGDSSDVLSLLPGTLFSLATKDATGYGVTAATADLLKIANSAGSTSVTFEIALLGNS